MSAITAKIALSAGLALGALTLGAASASAMAIDPGVATTVGRAANIEQVPWVCGPYRCWWRPWHPYWRPRYYYGPGWRWPRWHRWHRWD